jgi:ABC-2 type transport system ATP-binding protein
MRMTGLGAFGGRRAGALSGGMKQKLGLACALVKAPEALLLDEPTVGVDPISRRELWRIVYALVEEEAIGVLLSTAYLDEAERCHRVVVLQEGRKLAEGPPTDFREQVRGRVFLVSPTADLPARRLQTRLVGRPGIVDATIRSGRVRVMSDPGGGPSVAGHLPDVPAEAIQPAAPTFEDAFMALATREVQRPGTASLPAAAARAGAEDEAVVQVRDLRKAFGAFQAVKGISFEVRRGEIFGLLGPNGAGKSTTFLMLCGLLSVSSGEVRVAGRNLRRARAKARQRLGYMAQHFSLYAQLTVGENLRFFGKAYGLWGRRLEARIAWAEAEFGLGPRRDEAAGALPGGFKQRLAMAAALLHEPEILFLDEPTSGVDPLARREFWARINGFAEQGMTVVVTTHFMEEAEYCDRMLIMSQGETLALGSPARIRGLARTADHPEPTIEEAFIALAEGRVPPEAISAANGAPGEAP